MFCSKCGKEVQEDWVTCPNCGNSICNGGISENTILNHEDECDDKKTKKKKPFFRKIWFWVFIVVLAIVITMLMSGDGEEKTDDNTKVQTLEEVGGYQQWKKDNYPGKVRTNIVVDLPVTESDGNVYCVHIKTMLGEPILIKQKDESEVSDWEWLNNASEDFEGVDIATFQATLTFDGGIVTDDEFTPRFIVEDIQRSSEESLGETSGVTSLSVTVQNDTGIDIYGLYASSSNSDSWEEDILGTDILYAGESLVIDFTYPDDETIWDFAMKDSDDNMFECYGLDFSGCSSDGAVLLLEYDGEQGYATLQ